MKLFHRWMSLFLVLAALGAPLAGCSAFGGSQTIVKYDRGGQPFTGRVYQDGVYALYSQNDKEAKFTSRLRAGDPIGFNQGTNGQVLGVAGSQEIPLNSNETYYWKKV
jgi:hypothetical protein